MSICYCSLSDWSTFSSQICLSWLLPLCGSKSFLVTCCCCLSVSQHLSILRLFTMNIESAYIVTERMFLNSLGPLKVPVHIILAVLLASIFRAKDGDDWVIHRLPGQWCLLHKVISLVVSVFCMNLKYAWEITWFCFSESHWFLKLTNYEHSGIMYSLSFQSVGWLIICSNLENRLQKASVAPLHNSYPVYSPPSLKKKTKSSANHVIISLML